MENQPSELTFQIGLSVQQLEPQHLRLKRDGMRAVEAGAMGLVDDRIRILRLLGHSADGSFEAVALSPNRVAILGRGCDRLTIEAVRRRYTGTFPNARPAQTLLTVNGLKALLRRTVGCQTVPFVRVGGCTLPQEGRSALSPRRWRRCDG
jgi:hypothetical protein